VQYYRSLTFFSDMKSRDHSPPARPFNNQPGSDIITVDIDLIKQDIVPGQELLRISTVGAPPCGVHPYSL